MASAYDYQTRAIHFDFHLVKFDEKCRLRGLPARVGGPGCMGCPFNDGVETSAFSRDYFVRCKHKDAHDSDGSQTVMYYLKERFERQALAAYYD